MRSRLTALTFLLMVMLAMSSSFSDRNQTLAADWSCKLSSNCPNSAQCSGDKWTRTGDCAISCYKETSTAGEIAFSGSANCATSSGGGGGGGGTRPTGFFYGEGDYCYNNWWWDMNCSGPDDPYTPPR
jgi:hypothetical protein